MAQNWQDLTKMTSGETFRVEKVRLEGSGIGIEGSFELPPLARLGWEDQIFAAAFIKSHGSIKEMERLFGVSYPTIKNRLNKISEALDFVKVDYNIGFDNPPEAEPEQPESDPLEMLDNGEIDFETALKMMEERKNR